MNSIPSIVSKHKAYFAAGHTRQLETRLNMLQKLKQAIKTQESRYNSRSLSGSPQIRTRVVHDRNRNCTGGNQFCDEAAGKMDQTETSQNASDSPRLEKHHYP